jgi:6-phosphogluconolactonase
MFAYAIQRPHLQPPFAARNADICGMADSSRPTRRDFIAASAAGLVALARSPESFAQAGSVRSGSELLYVGAYTDEGRTNGIHLVRMDRSTGKLEHIGSVESGANPSFLTIHPNGRVLYAANELATYDGRKSGAVSSFDIASESGNLTPCNERPSEGGAPCYVSVDRSGKFVLVANYSGGNIALLPLGNDGSLSAASHVEQHARTGPAPAGREAAHAHCIVADPSNRFVLAADLGVDRVFLYRLDVDGKALRHVAGGDGVMRDGAGPRHLAFHPTLPLVFVANELDSTVSTLRFDAERGSLTPIDTQPSIPAGWPTRNYPGDIHLTPSGRTLHVSNRGHNSISVFSVSDTGALALEQTTSTGGDWPRNFSLDPTGRWLLVANQRSGSIVVLACDPRTGRLTTTDERLAISRPACVRFRAHAGVIT